MPIQDLDNPIIIQIPVTISSQNNIIYQCKYWDDASGEWSTEGVNSVWVEDNFGGGHVTCLTSHLTTFAVFTEDTPIVTTTASSITTTSSSGKSMVKCCAYSQIYYFEVKDVVRPVCVLIMSLQNTYIL